MIRQLLCPPKSLRKLRAEDAEDDLASLLVESGLPSKMRWHRMIPAAGTPFSFPFGTREKDVLAWHIIVRMPVRCVLRRSRCSVACAYSAVQASQGVRVLLLMEH